MSVFELVEKAPEDPILGLNLAFQRDPRPTKVNLGVGAYKTEEGHPLVLSSVSQAEERVVRAHLDKEYQPIPGPTEYRKAAADLVMGEDHPAVAAGRVFAMQAVGGTGALRLGAELLATRGMDTIALSNPTWANHPNIFNRTGIKSTSYPYYDIATHRLDFLKLLESLDQLPPHTPVLLHACCHNPTGMDLSQEQWTTLSSLMLEKKLFPFFDFAYQGFGVGVEEDAWPIRHFAQHHPELLVAYSFAKNLGLYGERAGMLLCLGRDRETAERVGSRLIALARASYSNPPCHAARLVTTVLQNQDLRRLWHSELTQMRHRVMNMRKTLAQAVGASLPSRNFSFMDNQRGMFSFLGISKEQAERLTKDFAIYLPNSGRVNVAGLNSGNLDYVVEAITAVCS